MNSAPSRCPAIRAVPSRYSRPARHSLDPAGGCGARSLARIFPPFQMKGPGSAPTRIRAWRRRAKCVQMTRLTPPARHRMTILVLSHVFPPKPGGSGRWLWGSCTGAPRGCSRARGRWRLRRRGRVRRPVAAADDAPAAGFEAGGSWGVRGIADHLRALRVVRRLAQECGRTRSTAASACRRSLSVLALQSPRDRRFPSVSLVHGEELRARGDEPRTARPHQHVLGASARVIANSQHTSRF